MQSIFYILLGCIVVIFGACKNSQSSSNPQNPEESKALSHAQNSHNKKSKPQIKIAMSPDSTFVLQKTITAYTPERPYQSTDYFVYSLKKDTVVFQDSIVRGDVLWHDNEHLKVTKIPEIIESDYHPDDYTVLINIYTGKKKDFTATKNEHSSK